MKANVKLLKKQRRITDEFKKGIVKDFESGQLSIAQLSSLYGVHSSMIYRWIYKFSNFNAQGVRIIEMKMSSTEKIKELEKKVKELERIVGNKQGGTKSQSNYPMSHLPYPIRYLLNV